MSVEIRMADGIAEMVIDFPPVNALPCGTCITTSVAQRWSEGSKAAECDLAIATPASVRARALAQSPEPPRWAPPN